MIIIMMLCMSVCVCVLVPWNETNERAKQKPQDTNNGAGSPKERWKEAKRRQVGVYIDEYYDDDDQDEALSLSPICRWHSLSLSIYIHTYLCMIPVCPHTHTHTLRALYRITKQRLSTRFQTATTTTTTKECGLQKQCQKLIIRTKVKTHAYTKYMYIYFTNLYKQKKSINSSNEYHKKWLTNCIKCTM